MVLDELEATQKKIENLND